MTTPATTPLHPPGAGPGAQRTRDLAFGMLLIVFGLVTAGTWFFPEANGYVPLVVGIALLALFALTRRYGYAVAGGIVTGVGVGTWLAAETTVEGTWFLLALAVGFASVWPLGYLARPAIRNLWPLIPASILAAVGLIAITGTEIEAPLGQFLVAAVLVLLGFGLILRSRGSTDSSDSGDPSDSGATSA